MKLYEFYHDQFSTAITAEHVIEEIEYYARYGNWPVSVAVWLQRRRIQKARLTIKLLNLLPESWLKTPPVNIDDEIPF